MPDASKKPLLTIEEMIASSGDLFSEDSEGASREDSLQNSPAKSSEQDAEDYLEVYTAPSPVISKEAGKEASQRRGFLAKLFGKKKEEVSGPCGQGNPESGAAPGLSCFEEDLPEESGKTEELMPDTSCFEETSVLEQGCGREPDGIYVFRGTESGDVYVMRTSPVLAGCREDCDFVIPQEKKNHSVSRMHAYLISKNGKLYVKDISTNGTFIGYAGTADESFYRIPKDTEVEIKNGQVIRFADRKYMTEYRKG